MFLLIREDTLHSNVWVSLANLHKLDLLLNEHC